MPTPERVAARDEPAPAPRRAPPASRKIDERPPAPWDPFPLVELCVLLALILGVWGILTLSSPRGRVMLGCSAVLGSLGGLELSIREHFAGFRSHTLLLAGTTGVATVAFLYFLSAPRVAMLVVGVAVFATAVAVLRRAFQRSSGGIGWR